MLFIEEVLCVWKEMQNQNKGNCSWGGREVQSGR